MVEDDCCYHLPRFVFTIQEDNQAKTGTSINAIHPGKDHSGQSGFTHYSVNFSLEDRVSWCSHYSHRVEGYR